MKDRVEQYEEWANSVTREGGIPPALMEGYEYQEQSLPIGKTIPTFLKAAAILALLCLASFVLSII